MEKNNELFLKQNSIFGCLIGGTFIFASLLFILAGKGIVVNAQFHNIIMMLTIFGIFIGVRKYRDEQLAGVISYGKGNVWMPELPLLRRRSTGSLLIMWQPEIR